MTDIPFARRNLSQTILSLLGEISVNFVMLQSQIVLSISSVTSADRLLVESLLSLDNFYPLISKFKKSIIYALEPKKKFTTDIEEELDAIKKELDEIRKERNHFLHSLVYTNEEGELVLRKFKSNSKNLSELKPQKFILTENELIQLNNRIWEGTKMVYNFTNKVIGLFS